MDWGVVRFYPPPSFFPSPILVPTYLLTCFRMFSMRLIRRGLVLAWNLSSPAGRKTELQAPGCWGLRGGDRDKGLYKFRGPGGGPARLTQHCIVQAHVDHSSEVQHAEVALQQR